MLLDGDGGRRKPNIIKRPLIIFTDDTSGAGGRAIRGPCGANEFPNLFLVFVNDNNNYY
jgi:hypothetical protein